MFDIADSIRVKNDSNLAFELSHYWLIEALTRCFRALDDPDCTRLLGPDTPGATLPGGARVPGTSYELEPSVASVNIATMIRWADSDGTGNSGAGASNRSRAFDRIANALAAADYQSRQARTRAEQPLLMRDVLNAMINAYEDPIVVAPDTIAAIIKTFEDCVAPRLAPGQWTQLAVLAVEQDKLAATAVDDFMALLVA